MNKTELVIMAAGLSSRYHGLKQLDGMDDYGQPIMAYSVYDAYLAGFDGVTLIVGEGYAETFKNALGDKLARRLPVTYVEQKLTNVPNASLIPADRKRPWGTAHAILCCKGIVNRPFAVINSDDFYGRDSFVAMHDFLANVDTTKNDWAMMGYLLKNTVNSDMPVSRAACSCDGDYLQSVRELKVLKNNDRYQFKTETGYTDIDGNTLVSMNLWGFTTGVFDVLNNGFKDFFAPKTNLTTAELNLGDTVATAAAEKMASIKVIPAHSEWIGVTYADDKSAVAKRFSELKSKGEYPEILF